LSVTTRLTRVLARKAAGDSSILLFYVRPGEGESPQAGHPGQHQLPNQPFFVAYEPTALPVQSNDWWTGVGLQWYVDSVNAGWAFSWNDGRHSFERIYE
jgi:hypothetical protein